MATVDQPTTAVLDLINEWEVCVGQIVTHTQVKAWTTKLEDLLGIKVGQQEGWWECGVCKRGNQVELEKCHVCGTDKNYNFPQIPEAKSAGARDLSPGPAAAVAAYSRPPPPPPPAPEAPAAAPPPPPPAAAAAAAAAAAGVAGLTLDVDLAAAGAPVSTEHALTPTRFARALAEGQYASPQKTPGPGGVEGGVLPVGAPPASPYVSKDAFDDIYEKGAELELFQNGATYAAVHRVTGEEVQARRFQVTPGELRCGWNPLKGEAALLAAAAQAGAPGVQGLRSYHEDAARGEVWLVAERLGGRDLVGAAAHLDLLVNSPAAAAEGGAGAGGDGGGGGGGGGWEEGLRWTECEVREAARAALGALAALHGLGVAHRHVHPDTLCTAAGAVHPWEAPRLRGFGFACEIDQLPQRKGEKVGTVMFMAPEMLAGRAYTEAVDVWSLGAALFLLLGGYPPFYARTPAELEHRVKTGQFRFHAQYWDGVSPLARDLVSRMLCVNPGRRPAAAALLDHPWMKAPPQVLAARDLSANLGQLRRFHAKRELNDAHHPPHEHHLHFADLYETGRKLGAGAYGEVFLCTARPGAAAAAAAAAGTGTEFAVKRMDRARMGVADLEGLETEVAVLRELDHPNVIRLHNTFTEHHVSYLVLELVTGGELFDRLVARHHYHEGAARQLAATLVRTLAYLHARDVVHRDLKCENLLLTSPDDDADLKICDFGFACHVSTLRHNYEICGTPEYMPPEMWARRPYGAKADVWSAGVICFILLGGYMPFHGKDGRELRHRVRAGHYRFHEEQWAGVSKHAKDFISCMLKVNPAQRWSAADLLQHPWMTAEEAGLAAQDLGGSLTRIRRWRGRFRAGVRAVMAAARLRKSPKNGSNSESGTPTPNAGAARGKGADPFPFTEPSAEDHEDDSARPGGPRTNFADLYLTRAELGKGAFGTVFAAESRATGEQVAVKVMDRSKMSQADLDGLETEVAIMRELTHPHIVRLYDAFVENPCTYLVLELVHGGELFDRIVQKQHYTEREARFLVRRFLATLAYLHGRDVCHRDLKPENLLLKSAADDTDIAVADFGFACHVSQLGPRYETCGSPLYLAPEMLRGRPYDARVDVWSAGVIVYVLLGGYPPFYAENQNDLFQVIMKGEYQFFHEDWQHISEDAKNLIRKMLVTSPAKRATAEELLREPWLRAPESRLSDANLGMTVENLKRFKAKQKFKGAVDAVKAVNRLRSLGSWTAARPPTTHNS